MLSVEVPGHRQEQLMHSMIVRLLKAHLFLIDLNIGGARAPLAPLSDPAI